MSNLTLTPKWHSDFNQLETDEFILGGADGNINLAPKQLAESLLWLKQQVDKAGPIEAIKVGDVYTTTLNHTSADAVNEHHGYGTWQRYAAGRTLVGFSTKPSDPDEYKVMGEMFGSNTHTLIDDEMPSHKHSKIGVYNKFVARAQDIIDSPNRIDYLPTYGQPTVGDVDSEAAESELQVAGYTDKGWIDSEEQVVGDNQPHNNIQPSIVAQYWVRTA